MQKKRLTQFNGHFCTKLHKFQFNKNVIQTIKALYNKPTARIQINGSLSGPIELERGCRQGCPISPLLFALFIEPLSQMIRQNDQIHGVSLAGENKIAMFADDVLVYTTRPAHSLPVLLQTLSEFGAVSGYKLNSHKSQLLTFKYRTSQQFKDKYAIREVDSLKYLGVQIPRDLTNLTSENDDPLLSNIRKDLAR